MRLSGGRVGGRGGGWWRHWVGVGWVVEGEGVGWWRDWVGVGWVERERVLGNNKSINDPLQEAGHMMLKTKS